MNANHPADPGVGPGLSPGLAMAAHVAAYSVMSLLALGAADLFFGDTYCAALSLLTLGSFAIEILWSSSRNKALLWVCVLSLALFSLAMLSKVDSSSASQPPPAKFLFKN